MPTATTFALFTSATVLLVLLPGPNTLFILSRAVEQGRTAAFASAVGVELGTLGHICLTAVGISGLLTASDAAFRVLLVAGVIYLVYLGWRAFAAADPPAPESGRGETSSTRLLRQAALVNLLNPKVALFFVALLPQYTDPARGAIPLQILALGGVFFLVALTLDLAYAAAATGIAGWLGRHPGSWPWQRRVSGCVYLGLAAWTAASGLAR